MARKYLGKITSATFGIHDDYMFGCVFWFSMSGGSLVVCSGTKYLVDRENLFFGDNMTAANEEFMEIIADVDEILKCAKVDTIDKLVGIPVEVTIDDNRSFQDFRILEEVL
jgi:hypothetical protein